MIVKMKCSKCHKIMEFIESNLDVPINEKTMTGFETYYCHNCEEERTRNIVYTLLEENWK